MRRFAAPWDRGLTTSTIALLAVIAFTGIAGTSGALQAGLRGIALAVATFSSGIVIAAWAFGPRGYAIGDGSLRVLRNGWPALRVPLDEVQGIAPLEPDALRGSLKLMGMSGLFGYYGVFRSPAVGPYRMYATRGSGLVLVRTARHVLVLTPDPAEDFLEALVAAAPSARRERRPARR